MTETETRTEAPSSSLPANVLEASRYVGRRVRVCRGVRTYDGEVIVHKELFYVRTGDEAIRIDPEDRILHKPEWDRRVYI